MSRQFKAGEAWEVDNIICAEPEVLSMSGWRCEWRGGLQGVGLRRQRPETVTPGVFLQCRDPLFQCPDCL